MNPHQNTLQWLPGHELLIHDIVKAEGCHVTDARGKRYLDLESGVWCTSIGHAHPRVLKVLARQAAAIAHTGFNYTSPVVADTARRLLGLLDFDGGRCVLLCSGSEAVEFGVRAARMVVPRPLMLTMTDSYCGAYGSAHAKRPDEWHLFDWTVCKRCPAARSCKGGCEHFATIPFDRIGGHLLEPGSSSGLVHFPPKKLIQAMATSVQKEGGLVLVNEVTTGMGRTGEWFGFQHYGIAPDVVALGKGLGAGYPVSATVFSPRAVRMLRDLPVAYAQSHQNDPLGAAVAATVIDVIEEEGLIERGRRTGARLLAGLMAVRESTDRIVDIRSRGLMLAIELGDDSLRSRTAWLHRALVQRGFLVGRRPKVPVLRLDPPLTLAEEDIEAFLGALKDLIKEMP